MHRLASADPDRDFAHNKKTGNIYFLAVRGFTTEIPGIEGDDERYLKAAKTIVIEGTSDVVGGDKGRQLRRKVRSYAMRYNKLVLHFLKQQANADR